MLEFQNLALPCIMLTFVQVSEEGLIEIKMQGTELSLNQHIWFLESMTAKLATWLLGSMLRTISKIFILVIIYEYTTSYNIYVTGCRKIPTARGGNRTWAAGSTGKHSSTSL